jgi:hypothetical protein
VTFPFSGTQSGAIPPTQSPPPPEPQVLCQPGLDNGQVEWARRKVPYQSTIKHVPKNARITIEFISFSTFSFFGNSNLIFQISYLCCQTSWSWVFTRPPSTSCLTPAPPGPLEWLRGGRWQAWPQKTGPWAAPSRSYSALTFKSQSISANFSAIRLHWVLF